MYTYDYKIADLSFRVSSDQSFDPPADYKFRITEKSIDMRRTAVPDVTVRCRRGELDMLGIRAPLSPKVISFHTEGNKFIAYFCNERYELVHTIKGDMKLREFESVSVHPQQVPFENCVGEVIFRTALLSRGGIVIHSAGIECGGGGLIFSAPSGTGKSTQAGLWRQYKGASVLNGDRSAIRVIDRIPYVCGTPWSGSSSDSLNRRAPLKAIIMLRQAPFNRLTALSSDEAVNLMLPRCYLPFGSTELTDLALQNLENIIGVVPVYLFDCLPDQDAVNTVSQCVGVK